MAPRHVKPLVKAARLPVMTAASLVCLLLLLQFPTFAQDNIIAPAALGSLSGIVTNAAGDPLPGINVTLLPLGFVGQVTTTGADGRYAFHGLVPGTYRVGFYDYQYVYAPQYYGGAAEIALATDVMVSGNNVTGVDATLLVGAVIRGTVEAAPDVSLDYFQAFLFRRSTENFWEPIPGFLTSNSLPGPYEFTGLASGIYVVCVYSGGMDGSFGECYDDRFYPPYANPPSQALEFPVAAGETHTVDIVVGNIVPLSGRVRDPDGQPIAGVTVSVHDMFAGGVWAVTSDAEGRYRFGSLDPSGSYRLRFEDMLGRYFGEFYQDTQSEADAQLITVDSASRLVIDATLAPAARLTGTVTLETGAYPESIALRLWQMADDGTWQLVNDMWASPPPCATVCYDSATGAFSLGQVAAGRYRLSIVNWIGQTTLETFYGGETLDEAADIVLAEGETRAGLDIVLGVGAFEGSISGSVRAKEGAAQAGAAQLEALAGIEVALYRYPLSYLPLRPLIASVTDAEGRYQFGGLPAELYVVAFRDPTGRFAPSFFRNQPTLAAATPVTLTKGEAVDDVNAALPLGGSIRGEVHRVDGTPVKDHWVVVYRRTDEGWFEPDSYLDARIDVDGRYQLPGLAPGQYYLGVHTPSHALGGGWPLGFYPATPNVMQAAPVTVVAGQVVEGIDIVVDMLPSLYLPYLE